jgi:hypothetical protein
MIPLRSPFFLASNLAMYYITQGGTTMNSKGKATKMGYGKWKETPNSFRRGTITAQPVAVGPRIGPSRVLVMGALASSKGPLVPYCLGKMS